MGRRRHERMGRWLNGRMAVGRDTKMGRSRGSIVAGTQTRALNSVWQMAMQTQPFNVIGRRSLSRDKGLQLWKKRDRCETKQS